MSTNDAGCMNMLGLITHQFITYTLNNQWISFNSATLPYFWKCLENDHHILSFLSSLNLCFLDIASNNIHHSVFFFVGNEQIKGNRKRNGGGYTSLTFLSLISISFRLIHFIQFSWTRLIFKSFCLHMRWLIWFN